MLESWYLAAVIAAGVAAGWLLRHLFAIGARRVLQSRLEATETRVEELRPALAESERLRTELHERLIERERGFAELAGRSEGERRRVTELLAELQARTAALDSERELTTELQRDLAELRERLIQERRGSTEKLALLEEARTNLADAFKALSSEALKHNNESFLRLAQENLSRFQEGAQSDLTKRQKAIEELTRPIRESLSKVDGTLGEMEKSRVSAYSALDQQLQSLLKHHLPQLHAETANLVKALRQPAARGRWGEVQLKRVVEMAGMLEHCDFDEQVSQNTEGGRLRPDMIVNLPGGRRIVVDAKAPVDAYLTAVEAPDEITREAALLRHGQQVRTHISQLGRKSYFEQFEPSPEFVVMFVPGEAFFSAALAQDPNLIEFGAEQRVIPASPTTLIALLKAVAYGWRQEAMARNAVEVAALGKELYDRIATLAKHWEAVGSRLDQAVDAYNKSVGTLERRVLPSARKFRDLKTVAADAEIDPLSPLTEETRRLTAAEFDVVASPDMTD
ncbi:DNA recombination protein RmuC [Acidihalobacter yilgarnensis]|uniref:DNA recombination protein RmuC n=1 Tax=Acidihalobacter yilgarnensis TaxID=2819280 RepID=UPI000A9F0346|nr:DNA recombination protein RmuC [Acidihalobacter yilgarnensis]